MEPAGLTRALSCSFRTIGLAWRAECSMQSFDHRDDFRSRDAIKDSCALPAGFDQPIRPQPHQLLRHWHLPYIQFLTQLGD